MPNRLKRVVIASPPRPSCSSFPPQLILPCYGLVIVLAVENPKNSQEQVDDVEIERDSSSNLLFHVIMSHDQLRIHKDVAAENQGRDSTVDQLDRAVCREEGSHEPKQNESPQSSKQIWHPACEVVFCLTGEDGQGDEDSKGQDESLNDNTRIVEGCDHADRVCLECRENTQEEQIGRIALALPVGEEHEADGAEE